MTNPLRSIENPRRGGQPAASLLSAFGLLAIVLLSACSTRSTADIPERYVHPPLPVVEDLAAPSPDPRVGLAPGLFDAGESIWNLERVSFSPSPEDFIGSMNSDLAFSGDYAIQGNFNGYVIWDISDAAEPTIVSEILCPASQSDVSIYGDLLFVSGEGLEGRLDCGTEGVSGVASEERLRGIRIFDISDIANPEYIANVQTCRGSHTHSVLEDPNDEDNIYVYVSGSAPVRPEEELPGCSDAMPEEDPESALFRIEVIQVPLDRPEESAIVSSPRIFEGLEAPPQHSGITPAELEAAREREAFIVEVAGEQTILSDNMVQSLLSQVVQERGGEGTPTAADSTALREVLPELVEEMIGEPHPMEERGPNQCHDITLYPELGIAGGACEGYGLLLDISDPANPTRIDAVADENFAYWHSATFNNTGDKVLFTDEWGGGVQPKCREIDPAEWGANAIFTIEENELVFQSYFKLPAPQTAQENCVAHNGSLIPIPGRDVMVQAWYQGGINVIDWTDPANPIEIAYQDRGPVSDQRLQVGGSWSVYWYNGLLVSSEIARGLDIFELTPSNYLTQNEIDAANTVVFDELNPQGQPNYDFPPTFALARAWVDQLDRQRGLDRGPIARARWALDEAEDRTGSARSDRLQELVDLLESERGPSGDHPKLEKLIDTVRQLQQS
ncbi:MAG: LVIVD repeat-containing protein [Bacteroidota bacterium]